MLEPASGRPKLQQPARDLAIEAEADRLGRCRNSTAPTSRAGEPPDRRGSSRPCPRARSTIETIAPSQLTTWSISIRRPARNSRCSSAAGVATTPLMIDAERRARGRRRWRPARPSPRRTRAPPPPRRRRRRCSTAIEIVATVGAISRGEPGQRTIARLTPSSLKLRTASSASSATANVPNSSGPRIRASAMPIASVPEPRDHRVEEVQPERPTRPRRERRAASSARPRARGPGRAAAPARRPRSRRRARRASRRRPCRRPRRRRRRRARGRSAPGADVRALARCVTPPATRAPAPKVTPSADDVVVREHDGGHHRDVRADASRRR